MNLLHLRAFHAVASEGSYVRAARRLFVTQPTLSGQVKALEDVHGARLFERVGRGIALSETGRALLAVTTELFRLEGEAEELLRGAESLTRGRLRVGADAPYHVVPLVAAFRKAWPGIDVAIALGNSASVRAALVARETDVAILPELDAADDDAAGDALWSRPLVHDRVVLLIPRAHPLAKKKTLALRDLGGVDLVVREEGSTTRAVFERGLAAAQVTPGRTLAIGSREGVREAVAAGLGVGIVFEREHVRDARIEARPIRGAALTTVESVACLARRRTLPVVAAFLALAQPAQRRRDGVPAR